MLRDVMKTKYLLHYLCLRIFWGTRFLPKTSDSSYNLAWCEESKLFEKFVSDNEYYEINLSQPL